MTIGDATDPGWIDHAALRRLLDILGNDPDELAELMSDYLADAPDLTHRMINAAQAGDSKAFRIAAHTLKSNARDFGAIRLSDLCAAAEAAAASSTLSGDLAIHAEKIASAEQAARQALSQVSLEELRSAGERD